MRGSGVEFYSGISTVGRFLGDMSIIRRLLRGMCPVLGGGGFAGDTVHYWEVNGGMSLLAWLP